MAVEKAKYLHKIEDLPQVNLTGDEKLPSMANLLLTDKMLISFIEQPADDHTMVTRISNHASRQALQLSCFAARTY